jgi:hypothetical protein
MESDIDDFLQYDGAEFYQRPTLSRYEHGIGLNMFYTLREVSQMNELCAGFEDAE